MRSSSLCFVVLYASSQVDKRRVGKLSLAIQVAFQELGVFETSNTRVSLSNTESVPFSQVQAVENIERTSDKQQFVQPMKGIVSPAAAVGPLKDIHAELEKAVAPEIRSRVVDIKTRKEGLVVSLREESHQFRTDTTTVKFAPSYLFFPRFCAKNGLFSTTTSRPLIA